jgi:hypothetical protein
MDVSCGSDGIVRRVVACFCQATVNDPLMRFCPGEPSVAGILAHNFGSDEQMFGAE